MTSRELEAGFPARKTGLRRANPSASLPVVEAWQYLVLVVIGVISGIINVVAGGGSLLVLPAMILMGVPEAVANGTNRIAIIAQNVAAVEGFRRKGFADFGLSVSLSLCTIPGALAGAWCGAIIPGLLFNRILAVVMLAVVVLMAWPKKKSTVAKAAPEPRDLARRRLWGHLSMVGIGFYGGFILAGVGFLMMAALGALMRLDLVRVNMHKVFIIGFFTLATLAVFAFHGKVWLGAGLALALGTTAGGWIGSHLSISRGEVFIRRFLIATVLVMAIKLFLG